MALIQKHKGSISGRHRAGLEAGLDFGQLLGRLRERLKARIRNGEFTERGLARRTGLSQSHIHNVLKGARNLTPIAADQILAGLRMPLLDLVRREELEAHLAREAGEGRERGLWTADLEGG